MIRLLIVHEVPLIMDLTASALRQQVGIEVVACMQTTEAALTLLRHTRCDVMLVSVTLPQDGAATLTGAVAKMPYPSKILITGLMEAKALILHWLEAGVAGYVHTDESLPMLVQKIRSVAQGEYWVSPSIGGALIARIGELRQQVIELNGLQALNPDTLYVELSTREREVLSLIEQHYTNEEIGNALYIELGTVKNHVHNILDKLGVRTRKQAATIARQALANVAVPINV